MSDRNDYERGLIWFLCGSLIGAGVALLLAPQSGRQTRKDIRRMGRNAWKRADRFTADMQQSLGDLMSEIGRASENAVNAGRDISAKTRDEVLDILDSGRKFLEEEKKRWEKTLRA